MGLKLITPPADYPVTLEEAKAHLVVEHTEHDSLIEIYVAAATQNVDGPTGFLGRALIEQTWDYYLDAFPGHRNHGGCRHAAFHTIEIPLPPLIEVVEFKYQDSAGNEQDVDPDLYVVDFASEPARIVLLRGSQWPMAREAANAIRIRFRAGYLTSDSPPADNTPFPIKAGILLHVGDLYRNRETNVIGARSEPMPWSAEQLLRPYRVALSLA